MQTIAYVADCMNEPLEIQSRRLAHSDAVVIWRTILQTVNPCRAVLLAVLLCERPETVPSLLLLRKHDGTVTFVMQTAEVSVQGR